MYTQAMTFLAPGEEPLEVLGGGPIMTSERLLPGFEREHLQWIQEVTAVIEPASRPDAGVWARWNALRYLQTTFPERLDQERRLIEGMAGHLTDDQREIL